MKKWSTRNRTTALQKMLHHKDRFVFKYAKDVYKCVSILARERDLGLKIDINDSWSVERSCSGGLDDL